MRSIIALLAVTALMVAMLAMPASAQQTGLVNVAIEDTDIVVQVPVAIAANICDVTVLEALARHREGDVVCEADADAVAQFAGRGQGQGQG